MKNVKIDLENFFATLANDFVSLMEKTEKLGDIAYVVEVNGLKRKRSEKIEEVKKLEERLECLEKKKKIPKEKLLMLLEKKGKFLFIKLVEA